MTWWWLSFADDTRPKGKQFLGACIVQGEDIVEAALEAHVRGCNPGGQVLGAAYPEGAKVPPEQWRNHLLSKAECVDMLEGVTLAKLEETN